MVVMFPKNLGPFKLLDQEICLQCDHFLVNFRKEMALAKDLQKTGNSSCNNRENQFATLRKKALQKTIKSPV